MGGSWAAASRRPRSGPARRACPARKPLLPCKVGHGGAELPAGALALCGRWRPAWYRVARQLVVATVPALVHPLLRVARYSRHCASLKGSPLCPLGGLLPHFSAPVLRIAQRVSASECAARSCALALAHARRDASAPFLVCKNSESPPRPILEEELFAFLRAASARLALPSCCLALHLTCPDAIQLFESCPCLAHLA